MPVEIVSIIIIDGEAASLFWASELLGNSREVSRRRLRGAVCGMELVEN